MRLAGAGNTCNFKRGSISTRPFHTLPPLRSRARQVSLRQPWRRFIRCCWICTRHGTQCRANGRSSVRHHPHGTPHLPAWFLEALSEAATVMAGCQQLTLMRACCCRLITCMRNAGLCVYCACTFQELRRNFLGKCCHAAAQQGSVREGITLQGSAVT